MGSRDMRGGACRKLHRQGGGLLAASRVPLGEGVDFVRREVTAAGGRLYSVRCTVHTVYMCGCRLGGLLADHTSVIIGDGH